MSSTASKEASEAAAAFLDKTAQLLQTSTAHLEPATVTQYAAGQYQRKHIDGRHHSDFANHAAYMQVPYWLSAFSAVAAGTAT